MRENSFYEVDELNKIGFKTIGADVHISRYARFYDAHQISIGNHVRIDDFCILSGNIVIGNYVHVAAYSAIFAGNAGVVLEDFSNISSRCAIYAKSDDYSGNHMTNPMVDSRFLGVIEEKVTISKHCIIGSGCTILPGCLIGEGVAIGAMSLVNKNLDSWRIYAGIPCMPIRERSNNILELEKQFISSLQ